MSGGDEVVSAVLTLVVPPPTVLEAELVEVRVGHCLASVGSAPAVGATGVLSVKVDGGFVSRPIRVAACAPDGLVTLQYTAVAMGDPGWDELHARLGG